MSQSSEPTATSAEVRAPTTSAFGDLSRGTLRGVPFRALRAVLLLLCRLLLGMKVEGLANVPATGGVVLVSNHLHNADPVLISIAFPRPLHFMAKKELFGVPVVGWGIRLVGSFPVDRGRADRTAIRRAQATLEQGIALGIFPEGTRSRTRRIARVHTGVGLVALRGNAPILPMAITGSERLPGSGGKAPQRGERRREVRIVFGEPFTLQAREDGKRMTADEATDLIMRRAAALLPESYRGIYGSPESADSASIASSAAGKSPDSS
ncbi:MAG: 1-acyl-sn-glycerol-3-phosphate acyltransferase [Chloroflexia bacterium]|nr:1-acyl-sn-glycerol-3-phosphate acyltransferase [Chloroflexia bacterium]